MVRFANQNVNRFSVSLLASQATHRQASQATEGQVWQK